MATTQYKRLLQGDVRSYDPDTEGFFALAFLPGADGKHVTADGQAREVCLAQGCIGTPSQDRARVERSFSVTLAEFPFLACKLAIYKVPCAFSNRESWVKLADAPAERWARLGAIAREWSRASWTLRDGWEAGNPGTIAAMERELANG